MRRSATLLAALAALVSLAACRSSSPDEDAARERLFAAVAATRDAGTSALSIEITEAVGGGTGEQRGGGSDVVRLAGDGAIDHRDGRATLSFDLGESASPLLGGGKGEIRAVEGTFYVRVPGFDLGGKPWLRLDPSALTGTALAGATGLQDVVAGDPTALLDLLGGARRVRPLGSDTVRGTETRHFSASLDVAQAARRSSGARRQALERLAAELSNGPLPVEVWLDDDDRVRRFKVPIVTRASAQNPEPARVTTTLELFDFGRPVDVQAPPPDEVVDATPPGR